MFLSPFLFEAFAPLGYAIQTSKAMLGPKNLKSILILGLRGEAFSK